MYVALSRSHRSSSGRAQHFVAPFTFSAADLSTFASSSKDAAAASTAAVLRDSRAPSYGQLQSEMYGAEPRVLSRINSFGEVERDRPSSPNRGPPIHRISNRQLNLEAERPY